MNAVITVGGLMLALSCLVGTALLGFGALAYFAAGMSTNPEASSEAQKQGCSSLIFGALLLGAGLWGLLA